VFTIQQTADSVKEQDPPAILLTAGHQNIRVKSVGVFKKEGSWRRWGVAASVAGVRGSFGTLGRARSRDLR